MSGPGPWIDAGTTPASAATVFVWWPRRELGIAMYDGGDRWGDGAADFFTEPSPLWWMPVPPVPGVGT